MPGRAIIAVVGLIVIAFAVIGCLGEVGSSAKGYYEIQSTREVVTAALRDPGLTYEVNPGAVLFIVVVLGHVAACLRWPRQLLYSDGMVWPWLLACFYPLLAAPLLAYVTLPFAPFILSDLLAVGRMDGEAWDDGGVLWLAGHVWILLSTTMIARLYIFRIRFLWKHGLSK